MNVGQGPSAVPVTLCLVILVLWSEVKKDITKVCAFVMALDHRFFLGPDLQYSSLTGFEQGVTTLNIGSG